MNKFNEDKNLKRQDSNEMNLDMKEAVVSFTTAKLAKEKGFNIRTVTNLRKPTQSLLQKWLREEHNIHVSAFPVFSNRFFPTIRKFYKDKEYDTFLGSPYPPKYSKNTYEEALECGLQEALKLIEYDK